jgi:hypothetical protein
MAAHPRGAEERQICSSEAEDLRLTANASAPAAGSGTAGGGAKRRP